MIVPLLLGGQVFAASESITQQITVTAIVPSHRDIILDKKGQIVEIDSNTKEDVTPDVYAGSYSDAHKQPLTDEVYAEYRTHVPAGTAKYGVLYKRPIAVLATSSKPSVSAIIFSRFLAS
jgi:hypothetical protein